MMQQLTKEVSVSLMPNKERAEISDKLFTHVSLSQLCGFVPKIIKENVRMLQCNQSKEYMLHVVHDIQNNTHYFDLRKKLREKGFRHHVIPADRQKLEKINHLFNASSNEPKEDQTDIQNRIKQLIRTAVEMRTSDIHIQVGSFTRVMFRIDGTRREMKQFETTDNDGRRLIQTLYNSMCDERSSSTFNYNEPADARIREEYVQEFGLSTGRLASRPGGNERVIVVIRLISRRKKSLTLAELGLTEREQAAIRRALARPAGVIYSSGPTGHGKSTLSQCMAEIYTAENPGMNMVTVEDPIESPIEGAFQTPLIIADRRDSEKLSHAWERALSNILRIDPDAIYYGEVRDGTSGNGVALAAQTGHLVLTTIHTERAIDIIQRLQGLGVEQDLLTDAALISCLTGLRLVQKLCPQCKKPYHQQRDSVASALREVIEKYACADTMYLVNPAGCESCNHSGILGRTGVFEVIETDYTFMRLYAEKGKFAAWQYWRAEKQGVTLCQNAIRLINSGLIDPVITHKSVCNLDQDAKFYEQS